MVKVLLSDASGSGKSYSALKIATGIAKKCNSGIAYIGTEGSRNKYYANDLIMTYWSLKSHSSVKSIWLLLMKL